LTMKWRGGGWGRIVWENGEGPFAAAATWTRTQVESISGGMRAAESGGLAVPSRGRATSPPPSPSRQPGLRGDARAGEQVYASRGASAWQCGRGRAAGV
jgi:hypothetical protein